MKNKTKVQLVRRSPKEYKAYVDGFNYALKLVESKQRESIEALLSVGKTLQEHYEKERV